MTAGRIIRRAVNNPIIQSALLIDAPLVRTFAFIACPRFAVDTVGQGRQS
jgi:hypothetical protein